MDLLAHPVPAGACQGGILALRLRDRLGPELRGELHAAAKPWREALALSFALHWGAWEDYAAAHPDVQDASIFHGTFDFLAEGLDRAALDASLADAAAANPSACPIPRALRALAERGGLDAQLGPRSPESNRRPPL